MLLYRSQSTLYIIYTTYLKTEIAQMVYSNKVSVTYTLENNGSMYVCMYQKGYIYLYSLEEMITLLYWEMMIDTAFYIFNSYITVQGHLVQYSLVQSSPVQSSPVQSSPVQSSLV